MPVLPYYLLQPKATSGPPRHPPYLGAGKIIVMRDQQGWRRAKLTNHTNCHRNAGYEWGNYVSPADPAIEGDAVEHRAHLEPGQDWGVLRWVDTALHLSQVTFHLPTRQQLAHTITSTCEGYNGGEIKVFKEEMEYLQDKLPFKCAHGIRIIDFQLGTSAAGPILRTPCPGYPLLPLSNDRPNATRRITAPSTVASTMNASWITTRCTDIETQFDNLVYAYSDLEDAIKNCSLGR